LEVRPTGVPSDEPTVGTGYLIDAERGYVLTADHVVGGAAGSPKSTIDGESIGLPDKKLKLKIVARREDQDTALLQVTNRDLIREAKLRPFEIALHFLPEGTEYVTIGYPRGKDLPNRQTAEWQGIHEGDGRLDVKQDVDEGSSGSPLIDENGAVVATCVQEIGRGEALYTPLLDVEDLLQSISPDARSDWLDRTIRGKAPLAQTQRLLIQKLKWISTNLMNLEFYAWAHQASTHKKDYESVRPYLECPVLEALSDRRLADSRSVQIIAGLSSANLGASLTLKSAKQDLLLGRTAQAEAKSQQASLAFQQLKDPQRQAEALAISAQANLWQKQFENASKDSQSAVQLYPSDPVNKVYLAQAYAGLGKLDAASSTARDAAQHLSGTDNRGGEAFALKTWGEIEARQGNFTAASEHLKQSSKLFGEIGYNSGVTASDRELSEVARGVSGSVFVAPALFPVLEWLGGFAALAGAFALTMRNDTARNYVHGKYVTVRDYIFRN
jgi:tetratricopeptide (TPR) repeat protein